METVSANWNGIPPESDGELELSVRLVTDGHHPGVGLTDPTTVVLLLAHVVDDVPEHDNYIVKAFKFRLVAKAPLMCDF